MHAIRLLPLALLLAAGGTAAASDCRHSAPRDLQLDLAGVERLVIELGRHELVLTGVPGSSGRISGKACATDAALLPHLDIEQQREGSTLRLRAAHVAERHTTTVLFGSHYEYLVLQAEVPQTLPVELQVGSGDARVDNLAALELGIGSGDVEIGRIDGPLSLQVGSGDVVAADVGALRVDSIGSGDASIRRVRGAAEVGSVGSGDLALRAVDGDVRIGSIGSGDVALHEVRGSVTLRSLGSGDLVARDVGGNLTVERSGSGDIRHSGVSGTVTLPRKR